MLNGYDEASLQKAVLAGQHRATIGGLWDEIGQLQFDFLCAQGLQPHHRLIDIGAGAMRAGVHLARYLNPGCYFAIDISAALLSAGRGELVQAGIAYRVPEENMRITDAFDLSGFPTFDFGIAQSVFTHLPLQRFGQCLRAVRPHFRDGHLFSTFFLAPPGAYEVEHAPGGIVTFSDRDPIHFEADDILKEAERSSWSVARLGPWAHPRDQWMCDLRPT